MAKEYFFYRETKPLYTKLEELTRRSGVSRGQAFEDFLTAVVCALAAETKEAEYLAMVERHKSGAPGKRGVDLLGAMFGELITAMDASDADILGDLYQGAITYGEAGQYFTPETIAELLANLTVVQTDAEASANKPRICDPCVGTGRMLLEAAKRSPEAELWGQDVDARCTKITAINLGLRGLYGYVLCGNSLTENVQFAYRIGSFFHESPHGLRRGVIRDVPKECLPVMLPAKSSREKSRALFEEIVATPIDLPQTSPRIVEVPPWLARLERMSTPQRQAPPQTSEMPVEPTTVTESSPCLTDNSTKDAKLPPGTQRELF